MSLQDIGRMSRWLAARAVAGILLGIAALAPEAADAQTKTAISVSASATSVVGDGQNQVTIVFSWTGTISGFPGDPLVFEILDPNDGFNTATLEIGSDNRVQYDSPSNGIGPINVTLTTQALPPGGPSRTLSVRLIASTGSPYGADTNNSSVEVVVTAPPAPDPEVSVRAVADTVVGDGTNEVEIFLDWMGSINWNDAGVSANISDPDDGIDTDIGAFNQVQGQANVYIAEWQAESTSPLRITLRTRALSPGDPDRIVTITVISFPNLPYVPDPNNGSVSVTITAPPAPDPEVSVSAAADTVVGDGTNEVVINLAWTGNIATTNSFVFDLADPDDAIDSTLEGIDRTQTVSSATGPQMIRLSTKMLPGGATDRQVTFTLKDGAGYSVASGMDSVTVTVTSTPPSIMVPTGSVLVSNIGQGSSGARQSRTNAIHAQAFTTGSNNDGYTLSSIVLDVESVSALDTSVPMVVTLNEATNDDNPSDTALTTLSNPDSYVAGSNTFMASEIVTLTKDTKYYIVVNQNVRSGGLSWTRVAPSDNDLDSGAASGWTIDDQYKVRSGGAGASWTTGSSTIALKIQVRGVVVGVMNNVADGNPMISGTAKVGEELTAVPGTITDGDGGVPATASDFDYQWQREVSSTWTNIQDADSITYTLVKDDEGQKVRVVVAFVDTEGTREELFSTPTATVARRDNMVATGTLQIRGPLIAGQQVTVVTSSIADGNGLGTFSYRWREADDISGGGAMNISGATSSDYMLQALQLDKYIQVEVSFTDADNYPESITSDWTMGAVEASGTTLPEVSIRANESTIEMGGNSFPAVFTLTRTGVSTSTELAVNVSAGGDAFNNPRINQVIFATGETTSEVSLITLQLETGEPDTSGTLTVQPGDGYTLGSPSSAEVMVVFTEPSNEATGMPDIEGTVQVGQTLMATRGTVADLDGIPTGADALKYQWQRETASGTWEDISGATSASYHLTFADEGRKIRVVLSFRDRRANDEMLTSNPTEAVAAASLLVTVAASVASVAGGEDAVFTLSRTGNTASALTVGISITGTGAPSTPPGTATFSANSPTSEVSVETSALAQGAPSQSVTLTILPNSDGTYGVGPAPDNMATVTVLPLTSIGDPEITVAASAASVVGGEDAVFVLSRTGNTASALTVGISITGTGATSPLPDTATFNANSTTSEVSVTTSALAEDASSQSVTLTIEQSTDSSYLVGPDSSATVSVEAPTLGYTVTPPDAPAVEPAPGSAPAAANQLVFTVRLSPAPNQPVTVPFSLGGTAEEGADKDYTVVPANKMLIFDSNTTSRTITVSAVGDIVAEDANGETVILTFMGETYQGIINDPQDQISVSTTDPQYEVEDGVTIIMFSFNDLPASTPAPRSALVVPWRVIVSGNAGSAQGMVTYAAGSRMADNPDVRAEIQAVVPSGRGIQVQIRQPSTAANLAVVPADPDNVQVVDGEWVVAGEGTVVEKNSDVLSQAVAVAGRAAATGIVDGIWRRAAARRAGGMKSHATLGGLVVDTQALSSGDAGQAVREVASLFGVEVTTADGLPLEFDSSFGGDLDDYRSWAGVPDQSRLASQTSFALPVDEGAGRGAVAFWGEFSTSSSELEPDENSLIESDSSDILVGIDITIGGNAMLGLAVSQSSGESMYRDDAAGIDSATAETSILTIAPYVHRTTSSGREFWGSLGVGSGTLTRSVNSKMVESDLSMQMVAAGARVAIRESSNSDLSVKVDALSAQTKADQPTSASGSEGELSTGATRVRGAFVRSSGGTQGSNGALQHRLELGARLDSGDAGSGFGADIAGTVRYAPPATGFELNANASMIVFHTQSGFKELDLGLSAIFDPGRKGRGVSLSLEPTWNAPRTGVAETMWGSENLGVYTASDAGAAMKARLGYRAGLLRDRFLAALYGESEYSDDSQSLRLGTELRGQDGPLERLNLDIYGERKETQSLRPVHSIFLEGRLGF